MAICAAANPYSPSSSSSVHQSENLVPSSSIPRQLGYRFDPKDEELIHHLRNKIASPTNYCSYPLIMDFDVYREEPRCLPWDPSMSSYFTRNERYFFVQRKPSFGKDTGKRPVRTVYTGKGWWNANGGDKPIYNHQHQVIGFFRTLTFFELKDEEKTKKDETSSKKSRKQKGEKTEWIMHEYISDKNNVQEWVLCRIHNKKPSPSTFSDPLQEPAPNPPQNGDTSFDWEGYLLQNFNWD